MIGFMKKEEAFNSELFFKALADRTRLRLLNLMRDSEVCVCLFAEALGTNNPKISRHLSYLKRTSLVKGRREGKWMHYQINKPHNQKAAEVFAATLEMLKGDPEMQSDREKLAELACSRALVNIQRNSKSNHSSKK